MLSLIWNVLVTWTLVCKIKIEWKFGFFTPGVNIISTNEGILCKGLQMKLQGPVVQKPVNNSYPEGGGRGEQSVRADFQHS